MHLRGSTGLPLLYRFFPFFTFPWRQCAPLERTNRRLYINKWIAESVRDEARCYFVRIDSSEPRMDGFQYCLSNELSIYHMYIVPLRGLLRHCSFFLPFLISRNRRSSRRRFHFDLTLPITMESHNSLWREFQLIGSPVQIHWQLIPWFYDQRDAFPSREFWAFQSVLLFASSILFPTRDSPRVTSRGFSFYRLPDNAKMRTLPVGVDYSIVTSIISPRFLLTSRRSGSFIS